MIFPYFPPLITERMAPFSSMEILDLAIRVEESLEQMNDDVTNLR
jgi:hypothetical protein